MYIDEMSSVNDLKRLLTGEGNLTDLSELLHMITNYSIQYCSHILLENDQDIFKSYKKIIEDQLKKYKIKLV